MSAAAPEPALTDQLDRLTEALERLDAALSARETRHAADLEAARRKGRAEVSAAVDSAADRVVDKVDRTIEKLETLLQE